MPSGSHASGGSHFGGSFGGGGSHFGGHSTSHGSGSYHPIPRGPRVMVFCGRSVYLSSGRSGAKTILGYLTVLACFIAFIVGMIWGSTVADIQTIERDYHDYCAMITHAQTDESGLYQVTANVTGYERFQSSDRYCIFYEFRTPYGMCQGHSYYVYTYHEMQALKSAGTVALAVDMPNTRLTLETDSIPMDYINTRLTDDAEYMDKQNAVKFARLGTIGAIVVAVGLGVAMVLVIVTAQKATDEQINAAGKNPNAAATTNTPRTWHCGYCGTLNADTQTTCESCGAKRTK